MNWRSVAFNWNQVRAFLVTAEEGALSAAARALGMAQPTIGRQIDALEEELGVTLFERVGRGLELTESGRRGRWPSVTSRSLPPECDRMGGPSPTSTSC